MSDTHSQLLKGFRELAQLTQGEAADWWGCSESHWQQMESGKRAAPRPLVKRLAGILKAKKGETP